MRRHLRPHRLGKRFERIGLWRRCSGGDVFYFSGQPLFDRGQTRDELRIVRERSRISSLFQRSVNDTRSFCAEPGQPVLSPDTRAEPLTSQRSITPILLHRSRYCHINEHCLRLRTPRIFSISLLLSITYEQSHGWRSSCSAEAGGTGCRVDRSSHVHR